MVQRLVTRGSGSDASMEKGAEVKDETRTDKELLGKLTHTTVNILLFPPLFFFYGLYYTDVLSVLSVLLTYYFQSLNRQNWVVVSGLVSLLFRQTNVFWVGIYLGALHLQRVLPRGRPSIEFPSRPSILDVVDGSWRHASIFDPLVGEAFFEGKASTL